MCLRMLLQIQGLAVKPENPSSSAPGGGGDARKQAALDAHIGGRVSWGGDPAAVRLTAEHGGALQAQPFQVSKHSSWGTHVMLSRW
jgi:hypothetical protein